MTVRDKDPWQELRQIDREVYHLKHVSALLGWDQETYMPAEGITDRAEQISLLETMIHAKSASARIQEVIQELGDSISRGEEGYKDQWEIHQQRAYLREWKRKVDRASKIPSTLVARFAYSTSVGQAKWAEAKQEASFSKFQPYLNEILILTREMASAWGYSESPYDPLLEEYEPGATAKTLTSLFDGFIPGLIPLFQELVIKFQEIDTSCLHLPIRREAQEEFGRRVLDAMRFPWKRGRLDTSVHPFSSKLGTKDVRITTRYNVNYFPTALFGMIHEAGHGLYELGFNSAIQGTILSDGVSMGIHESQSRFWENCIGRHRSFWKYWYPILKNEYLPALDGLPLSSFLKAINRVKPSLIRVEADEVSYPLHVFLRFTLEKALVEDTLSVSDLPCAWNEGMKTLLGVHPKNDAEGVLQDIHWSMGSFGYFPTYALGTLYAAQFFTVLVDTYPTVLEEVEKGDYGTVLQWLGEQIHTHGRIFPAEELCRRITGDTVNPECFLNYVREKYTDLFRE